ncbi:FAD/NAD(P)-binding protein [Gimesia maris]|uniref:FAD/NAD(P)-binding protein n=1 Tax=Gimesia maris TaxID=122 RepID=UPI00241CCCAC|nr:FAD/NAD(P)-binding protein [Gimesia maris]|tara:strand:- start:99241 stop:100686 length:1446 start_codon:yes stop_codon:yes gene_type:complete
MKKVAIIGGGFSGTMAAVNLARLSSSPLCIQLINDKYPLGRGVAYGTRREEHLLNVAARNMSAVPDHANHFLDWLRTRVDYSDLPDPQLRETYVPRRIYGDYLRSILATYMQPIDRHHPAEIQVIEQEAVDIEFNFEGSAEITLKDGSTIDADRVLLATGNQPPCPLAEDAFSHPGYCAEPWGNWMEHIPAPSENIIVMGTGLSMIDVFLTLSEQNWQGHLIAISHNGMIPQSHFRGIEYPDFLPEEPENLGLENLVQLLEKHCRQLQRIGENPGIVVDRLRPHTQKIWQKFELKEKQEFLKRYAARWNVIRHRIAQPIHQRVTEAITEGRLSVVRGRITGLEADGDRVCVNVLNRAGDSQQVKGGLVINCTGPNSGFSDTSVPLFQNLLQRGLIRPDELDMGIDVGADFATIDAEGNPSEFLFAIGPLMKGTLWETTAVPELRGQAMRVAQLLLDDAALVSPGHDYRISVEEEHVIEYYI